MEEVGAAREMGVGKGSRLQVQQGKGPPRAVGAPCRQRSQGAACQPWGPCRAQCHCTWCHFSRSPLPSGPVEGRVEGAWAREGGGEDGCCVSYCLWQGRQGRAGQANLAIDVGIGQVVRSGVHACFDCMLRVQEALKSGPTPRPRYPPCRRRRFFLLLLITMGKRCTDRPECFFSTCAAASIAPLPLPLPQLQWARLRPCPPPRLPLPLRTFPARPCGTRRPWRAARRSP